MVFAYYNRLTRAQQRIYMHHLDYELLRLADSFHTEGFYKRESSLVYQLVENKSLAIL